MSTGASSSGDGSSTAAPTSSSVTAVTTGPADGTSTGLETADLPTGDSGPDSTITTGPLPPAEVTRCPEAGASEAGTNTAVVVHADAPIDPATVGPDSLKLTAGGDPVPGLVEVRDHDLVFVPAAPLPEGQAFVATLAGDVRDALDRILVEGGAEWSFTTGAEPVVVAGFTFTPPTTTPSSMSHAALGIDGERAILIGKTQSGVTGALIDGSEFSAWVTLWADIEYPESLALHVRDGSVHMTGYTLSGGPARVFYSRVDTALAEPATTPAIVGDGYYSPRVVAGPDGRVAVAMRGHGGNLGFFLTTSGDNGDSFGAPLLVELVGDHARSILYFADLLVAIWTHCCPGTDVRVATSQDNGMSFEPAVDVGQTETALGLELIDNGLGELLLHEVEGFALGDRTVRIRTLDPISKALGDPLELVAANQLYQCGDLAVGAPGQLAYVFSAGDIFDGNAITYIRTSGDGGHSFEAPTRAEVIAPDEGCPGVGLTPSGALYLVWRLGSGELAISRGTAKRPCE